MFFSALLLRLEMVVRCSLLIATWLSLTASTAVPQFNLQSLHDLHSWRPRPTPHPHHGGKRVVSAVTNSPIYYINQIDLSSLLSQWKPSKRPAGSAKRRPPPPASSSHRPLLPLPIPFLSNAKPVGAHKLPVHKGHVKPFPPKYKPEQKKPVPAPYPMKSPSQSKIIRLPTRFVSNAQPHGVKVYRSPMRAFWLQNLLGKPAISTPKRKTTSRRKVVRRPTV